MKRSIALLVLLMSTAVLGQEDKKAEEYNSVREYRNRVFEVHNRDPREIASAVRLLGSGFNTLGEIDSLSFKLIPPVWIFAPVEGRNWLGCVVILLLKLVPVV